MNHQMLIANADIISLFVIALSAAFSHCYAMCGGIVLAYSQGLQGKLWNKMLGHLLYNLGRISTYIIIGIACAYLGAKFSVSNATRGGIFIIVGFLMFLFGIGYFWKPRILFFLEPNIGNFTLFKKAFNLAIKRKNITGVYFLGLLNGAIPCGIVYFFAMNATVAASNLHGIRVLLKGVEIMLVFGIATMIPMLMLGIFSSILTLTKFKNVIMKISALLIMLFGIYTIFKGFKILFA